MSYLATEGPVKNQHHQDMVNSKRRMIDLSLAHTLAREEGEGEASVTISNYWLPVLRPINHTWGHIV